jgi:hypothetical protein
VILRRERDLGRFSGFGLEGRGSFLVVSLIETNGCLKHQEDVVALFLDLTDHFSNTFRLGKGLVDGVSQLPHQALQVIVHIFSLAGLTTIPIFNRCPDLT